MGCFTNSTNLTHFAPKHYLGNLTRYEKYYKTTFVKHKKLDNMVEEKNENSEEGGSCQLTRAVFSNGLVAAGREGVCLTEQCLACFAGQLGWFILIQGRLGQLACLSPPIDPSRFTLACLQAPPPPLPLTWLAGPSSSSTTNLASFRDNICDPINLYHKVGHGKLDMYVLNPSKESREVKEFLSRWGDDMGHLGKFKSGINVDGKELWLPIANLVSICALVIWQPANPNDTITRLLFPGSTPQNKIFKGLEKLKRLECLKQPTCSPSSLKEAKCGRNSSSKDKR